jgi:hypothetical protein
MTPGAWIIKPRPDGLANVYAANGCNTIALCAKPDDARAIAALPDMLETLRAVADYAQDCASERDERPRCIDTARDLLARFEPARY